MDDFIKNRPALKKAVIDAYYGSNVDFESLTDLQKQNLQFAISSNERGFNTIVALEYAGINFRNAYVLDIGCAYGGYTIEACRRGASTAFGVDVNDHFIFLANQNLTDERNDIASRCKFLTCDMTTEQSQALPLNFFNVILVNDVFEHIYDTTRLMEIMRRVATPDCVLYFEIPNGLHFFDFVEKEPHYYEYGMSLLEPSYCSYKDVFYRRWDYYAALFSWFGFSNIEQLTPPHRLKRASICNELHNKQSELEKNLRSRFAHDDSETAKVIITKLEAFSAEMNHDMENLEVEALHMKYLMAFWKGIARK